MSSRFRIVFSAAQGAADLWTYGEDALVGRAEALADDELPALWALAGSYFSPTADLPLHSSLWADKARAFALITYFEGALRPLARERRRPRSRMPSHLANAQPVPSTSEWIARAHGA
ncbi:hypothetical protein [Agromyces silvae]|uniref:hypothetical protein n=1 Tax=Agromyces silvae TaxID=3388266 RepID=UPI00280BE668|nr:hypothetical protein [Agromyces protaetiae]